MSGFEKDDEGRCVCELVGGPHDGARKALKVDRPHESDVRPTIRKGDIAPIVNMGGTQIVCGLIRYDKAPAELGADDIFSVPVGEPSICPTADGGRTITVYYNRYGFEAIGAGPSGKKIPRFKYIGLEPIRWHMTKKEAQAMMRDKK